MKDQLDFEDLYIIKNNQKKNIQKIKWVFISVMGIMIILFILSLSFIVNGASDNISEEKIIFENQIEINNNGNANFCKSIWNWQYCPYYTTTHLSTGNILSDISTINNKL